MIGLFQPSLRGSELAKLRGEDPVGPLPSLDRAAIGEALEMVRERVRSGELHSAHDIAEGGLAVALAECCAGRRDRRHRARRTRSRIAVRRGAGPRVSSSRDPSRPLAGLEIIGHVGGAALEIPGALKVAVSELAQARDAGIADLV